jgi:hypothetical protein
VLRRESKRNRTEKFGKKIAFMHFSPGDRTAALYIMETNGDNPEEILKDEGAVQGGRPAWQPK